MDLPPLSAQEERRRLRRLKSATGVAYPRAYRVFRGLIFNFSLLFMKPIILDDERIPGGLNWRPQLYRRNDPTDRVGDTVFIITPNHGKVFDIPFVGLFKRPMAWVAKPAFNRWRWLAAMNQRMGDVPVFRPSVDGDLLRKGNSEKKRLHYWKISYRPDELFAVLKRALRRGVSVVMFPEGTRHGNAEVKGARYGAARLAIEENVPMLPIGIYGCAKGDRIVRVGLLRRQVIVGCVGEMIYPREYQYLSDRSEAAKRMTVHWEIINNALRRRAEAELNRLYPPRN